MLNLSQEIPLSLPEAAKRIPSARAGRPVHVSTVLRWILNGVNGVRLEAARVGGRWFTSVEALQRFADALTEARMSRGVDQVSDPADRDADLAEEALDRLGL